MANRFVWDADALSKMRFFSSVEEMRAFDELHREEARGNQDTARAEPAVTSPPEPTPMPGGSFRNTQRVTRRRTLPNTRRGK